MPKAKPRNSRLTVIQNSHLTTMAVDQKFLNEFPFLKVLQTAAKARGRRCCGNSDKGRAAALTAAKANLAALSGDKKRILKKLLNADKIRIRYKRGRQMVDLTF